MDIRAQNQFTNIPFCGHAKRIFLLKTSRNNHYGMMNSTHCSCLSELTTLQEWGVIIPRPKRNI